MVQLNILLEKLYTQKKDLELIMSIQVQNHCCADTNLNDQYARCLNNIDMYEAALRQHFDELPGERA